MIDAYMKLSFQQRNVIATLKDHATFIDGAIDTKVSVTLVLFSFILAVLRSFLGEMAQTMYLQFSPRLG